MGIKRVNSERWLEASALRDRVGLATKVVPHEAGISFFSEDGDIAKYIVFTIMNQCN